MKGLEGRLVARPKGLPRVSDFALVEVDVPLPRDGELLVRNTWMSLDPSMRIRMSAEASEYLPPFDLDRPLEGWAVGEVIRSRTPGFVVGDHVLHQLGWREFALLRPGGDGRAPPEGIDVDATTPARAYLGPLSWVGLSSYVGLLDVAELRPEDVVFVSAAAGAVGSLAVQIAKLRGNAVVGSAGSAAKASFVRDELGADAAFSYRDGDVIELLRAAAPDGIDVYFDNVGGRHLEAALDVLRPRGRVALCGAVSTYNATKPPPGPPNLFNAVTKGLTLRGFLVRSYPHRMETFRADMRAWLAEGSVTYREQLYEGLQSAPDALIDLLAGRCVGKVLVRLG